VAEADPTAPLCVTFRLTSADYQAGVRRLALTLWPIRLFIVVAVVAAVAALAGALLPYTILAIVGLLVFVVYAFMLSFILVIRPGQSFRRRADLKGDQTYCFSESGVAMTFGGGESRVNWSYFRGLLESKDLYVLRQPIKQLGSIIPRRAFQNHDAEARFRRLAQQIGNGSRPAL
jgi:hypothetical protein